MRICNLAAFLPKPNLPTSSHPSFHELRINRMVRSIVRAARIKGAQSHSCCGKHGGPRGYARTISRAVSLLQQSLSLLGRYRGGGDREVSKRGVIGEGKHAPQCLAQARRVSTMHCVRASAIFRDRATKFGRIEKLALRLAANAGDSAGANLGATRERVGDVLQEGVANIASKRPSNVMASVMHRRPVDNVNSRVRSQIHGLKKNCTAFSAVRG